MEDKKSCGKLLPQDLRFPDVARRERPMCRSDCVVLVWPMIEIAGRRGRRPLQRMNDAHLRNDELRVDDFLIKITGISEVCDLLANAVLTGR